MHGSLVPRILCFLLISSYLYAKEITIHGFVTAVNSPESFEIDDYKVNRTSTTVVELQKQEDENSLGSFKPENIRIGTELEIRGEYSEGSGELRATSIKVFGDDTLTIKRTALLEKTLSLTKEDSGWRGMIYADGQRIRVSPATAVSLKLNQAERKSLSKGKSREPLELTPKSLNLDTFVSYEGVRQTDGSIRAQKVDFQHAEIGRGEAKMWRRFTPKVTDPDYSNFQPGELKMRGKTFRTVPNREAQEYIARLGNSLIPAHQKDLPDGDSLKIPFRFYLVDKKSFNASCYPNGVVILHSGIFNVLENEAQLAFVLSHEISHAVEKHAWFQAQYHRNQLIALRAGGAFIPYGGSIVADLLASGVRNEYARSLENQADRVGLEWMLAAGYDIREAPESWKALSTEKGDSVSNPFWSSHDNITTRRSYLLSELRNNYSSVDYSNLKKDSFEFHQVADAVKSFEKAKASKNKKGEKTDSSPDSDEF